MCVKEELNKQIDSHRAEIMRGGEELKLQIKELKSLLQNFNDKKDNLILREF